MSKKDSAAFQERLHGHLEPTIGGSVYIKPQDMEWRPSQFEGVQIKVLYENKEAGELTCLLKWAPGSTLPFHKHPEIEQSWVLEGSFSDHEGICRAGEFVYRTPGSMHETHSAEGCTILAIYRKPNIFRNSAGYDVDNKKQVKTSHSAVAAIRRSRQ
jgi:quercetin dioxygenase-like cupin family protein